MFAVRAYARQFFFSQPLCASCQVVFSVDFFYTTSTHSKWLLLTVPLSSHTIHFHKRLRPTGKLSSSWARTHTPHAYNTDMRNRPVTYVIGGVVQPCMRYNIFFLIFFSVACGNIVIRHIHIIYKLFITQSDPTSMLPHFLSLIS